jgi:hypothetical protein
VPHGKTYCHDAWFFIYTREALTLALCHMQESDALHYWYRADSLIRHAADEQVRKTQAHLDSETEWTSDTRAMLTANLAAYRAFSEGRTANGPQDIAAIERMEAIYTDEENNDHRRKVNAENI